MALWQLSAYFKNGHRDWRAEPLALIAGTLLPLSLAPFNLWFLSLISPALLALLLIDLRGARGFIRSFVFGLGMFGVGTSWVFRSIYDFGFASLPLAVILTALFVTGLALVFALPFYLYCRFLNHNRWGFLIGFACVWTLGEWSRMWFLTGFPWLYLGYAHIDTWLAGWAPVAGVFCLSFLTVCTGLAISELVRFAIRKINKYRMATVIATRFTETRLTKKGFSQASCALSFVFILAFWVSGYFLHTYSWTQKQTETPFKIGIVQPNIPQHYKWEPYYYPYIMQTMRDLSSDAWQKVDLLLWPENAIPLFYHEANDYREELAQRAEASQTALITGILYDADEPRTWYNGIIGLGLAEGTYFKQRLVPFGEYVPMEDLLRGTIKFFNLPHSLITAGPARQAPLKMGESTLASSICYEVVYPDLVAEYADHSALLLTISNDAWFGDSIGPIQHFQMAQMRALENGKYMLRATNNGVSGVISEKGQILSTLPHFEQGTLLEDVYLMQGHTPFSRWKSWPIVFVCMLGVILVAITKQTENDESINLS